MADPTKAWDKAFTHGSSEMQNRLKRVHAKNPAFQSWLKSSGHGSGESVKQASKEVKQTVRAKQLAAKSATAYGATKGLAVGGEHGGAGVSQKADKGRVWSPAEVAAWNKQLGTEPVELSPAEKRKAIIAAAAKRVAAKKAGSFDVPTLQRQHDDLRDVHDSLHSRVTRSSMDEEAEQVDGGNVYDWDKLVKIHLKDAKNPNNSRIQRKHAELMASRALEASKMSDSDRAYRHYMGVGVGDNLDEEVEQIDERNAKNKAMKDAYVRSLGLKAMKDGKVDPAGGYSPTRFGRKMLRREEVEQMYEEPKDAADEGEYDYEGDMAKSQLRSIMHNAKRMHDMLEDNTNLPEWVQSKITLAEDYISTTANYMQGEMNEESEISEEGKVAVTPSEKSLAKYHGNPNTITYGDVIEARIRSAAKKAIEG